MPRSTRPYILLRNVSAPVHSRLYTQSTEVVRTRQYNETHNLRNVSGPVNSRPYIQRCSVQDNTSSTRRQHETHYCCSELGTQGPQNYRLLPFHLPAFRLGPMLAAHNSAVAKALAGMDGSAKAAAAIGASVRSVVHTELCSFPYSRLTIGRS